MDEAQSQALWYMNCDVIHVFFTVCPLIFRILGSKKQFLCLLLTKGYPCFPRGHTGRAWQNFFDLVIFDVQFAKETYRLTDVIMAILFLARVAKALEVLFFSDNVYVLSLYFA